MRSERGASLLQVALSVVIVGIMASLAIPQYGSIVSQARVNANIYQGRLIKEAIDLYQVTEGTQPGSISDLEKFLSHVNSAQEIGGNKISVDDNTKGRPIFDIDLVSGGVKVLDTGGQVVWDSR